MTVSTWIWLPRTLRNLAKSPPAGLSSSLRGPYPPHFFLTLILNYAPDKIRASSDRSQQVRYEVTDRSVKIFLPILISKENTLGTCRNQAFHLPPFIFPVSVITENFEISKFLNFPFSLIRNSTKVSNLTLITHTTHNHYNTLTPQTVSLIYQIYR